MPTPTPTPTVTETPTQTAVATLPVTPSTTPTLPIADPDLYIATNTGIVRKVSTAGEIVFDVQAHDRRFVITAMAVDSSGNFYTASTDKTVRKFNSSGVEQWSFNENDDVAAIAVDTSGNVVYGSFNGNVRKLDSSGSPEWVYGTSGYVRAVTTDGNDFVYIGTDTPAVIKISPVGGTVWDSTVHTKPVLSIAVDTLNNVYSTSRDNTLR
jgi:hypothetical protein